jgi:hypothetical protein
MADSHEGFAEYALKVSREKQELFLQEQAMLLNGQAAALSEQQASFAAVMSGQQTTLAAVMSGQQTLLAAVFSGLMSGQQTAFMNAHAAVLREQAALSTNTFDAFRQHHAGLLEMERLRIQQPQTNRTRYVFRSRNPLWRLTSCHCRSSDNNNAVADQEAAAALEDVQEDEQEDELDDEKENVVDDNYPGFQPLLLESCEVDLGHIDNEAEFLSPSLGGNSSNGNANNEPAAHHRGTNPVMGASSAFNGRSGR